jgi:subtilisin family serine protease
MSTTNDPYFPNQYGLAMIHVPEAWDLEIGKSLTHVAQFDTGVAAHPDLGANVVLSAQPPYTTFGTWAAGIVAATANNAAGMAGVCQHVTLHAYRTIWSEEHLAESFALAQAIPGLKIGLTGYALMGWSYRPEFGRTLDAWNANGTRLLVCPAGDTYSGGKLIKGSGDARLLAVGACNLDGTKASWSNYGRGVKLWAPGHSVVTDMGGGYASSDTTKIATAIVAGVAGLVASVNSSLTGLQIQQLLIATATPMACGPVVNALAAVQAAAP